MSDWNEITGNKEQKSDTWKPEKVNEEKIGVYVEKRTGLGSYNSTLYVFLDENGVKWSVFGDTVLNERFNRIQIGDEVKIQYGGKLPSKRFKGKYFKVWRVYNREKPLNASEGQPIGNTSKVEVKEEISLENIPF